MESSNCRNERRIRKFSVHLTRLTDEDIDIIRCQIKRKAEEKANKDLKSKTKKKKTSNCQSFEATAPSANCISESAGDDVSLNHRLQKPAKTKTKKKPTSSSSKRSKKKKCTPNTSSSKPSSRNVILDARASTWDEHKSYSTSEESELEEIFVPRKIWVKPSARPITPTPSKSDAAAGSQIPEIPRGIECNITSKFPIRKPVILLKKMIPDTGIKHEICDDTMPSTERLQTRNSSNTNCCLQWQKPSQRSSAQAVTILRGSDQEESESEESADEKLPQDLQTVDQSWKNDDELPILTKEVAPCNLASRSESIAFSEITANSEITGHSPPQCSCQLTVASPEAISSAVQTDEPEASTLLTNELAEASTQNTVSLRDAGAAERNQSNVTICSPIIFDEGSQATQELSCEISSPIIFGSNEGAAADSVDAPNESNNQNHDLIPDPSNSSSSFSLELSANEQCEKEAPSKNCDLTSDASQNFNLQLSENIPHQNVQSSVNSQEAVSSSSFALEIPGECTIENFSDKKNSQLFSSNENLVSSRTSQSSVAEIEAPCNLFGLEAANIPESENNDQFMKKLNFSGNQKVHLSALKDESHLESDRIWLSAAKPTNYFGNQNMFSYSVKSLNPKRPKISFRKKARNLSYDEKIDSSMLEDSSHSRKQRLPSFTAKAPHLVKSKKSNLSGPEASKMSKTKKSYSSIMKPPSFSESGKSCLSVSEAANIFQRSYLLPFEHLNPLGTQKSNLPSMKGTKLPDSVPINCNDAFTQTDPKEVHQQPSQLSVNYIINTSSLDTIRFEGPVMNHPSTMTPISEKIPASDSTFVADKLHCPKVLSPNRTKRMPCKCNVKNFFHCSEVSNLPESDSQLEKSSNAPAHSITNSAVCCSDFTPDFRKTAKQRCRDDEDDQFLASKTVIDSIDLTGDDEPKCEEPRLGEIRLKTPSELGCTIAFTDDVERLFRYELPKLQCNFDKLDLLKRKHFHIFKFVLAKYFLGKPVNDTLQELCSTRSVPCGSNLMRQFPSVGLTSMQMSVKSPALTNSTGQKLFYGNSSGVSSRTHDSMLVRGHHRNATVLGKPIC